MSRTRHGVHPSGCRKILGLLYHDSSKTLKNTQSPKKAASLQVYDLSEFMDRHPGGPTTILAWAGKDASKFFNDIHKGVKLLGLGFTEFLGRGCWGVCRAWVQ